MAVLKLYHHPTIATTTTMATTTTSTIAVRREHGRGGEKPGVWRWMRLGMRQRGREETRGGKFDVRTRRINGCFWRIAEKGGESERGSEKAARKTPRDDAGEKERRISIGNSGKDSKERGGSVRGVGNEGWRETGGGTRTENACQLDNSTSTSRP